MAKVVSAVVKRSGWSRIQSSHCTNSNGKLLRPLCSIRLKRVQAQSAASTENYSVPFVTVPFVTVGVKTCSAPIYNPKK